NPVIVVTTVPMPVAAAVCPVILPSIHVGAFDLVMVVAVRPADQTVLTPDGNVSSRGCGREGYERKCRSHGDSIRPVDRLRDHNGHRINERTKELIVPVAREQKKGEKAKRVPKKRETRAKV